MRPTPEPEPITPAVYDPISHELYYDGLESVENQEPEGDFADDESASESQTIITYLGFPPLYEIGFPQEDFAQFRSTLEAYLSENFPNEDVKYISLLESSLEKPKNGLFKFTVYLNSTTPISAEVQTAPEFSATYK